MSLEQLSKTVDFVQATTPSNANDGETYLDTSQSPPQLKVFDSSANAFVRPRSIQNLDAPVSGAGATQSDIEAGAANALEEDISTLSPASNSVADNLDGGVAAVDWSSKTPKSQSGTVSVSGSGYILSAAFFGLVISANGTASVLVSIDGGSPLEVAKAIGDNETTGGTDDEGVFMSSSLLWRFESGFDISKNTFRVTNEGVKVNYVLD